MLCKHLCEFVRRSVIHVGRVTINVQRLTHVAIRRKYWLDVQHLSGPRTFSYILSRG
jgi:hypothetical protein